MRVADHIADSICRAGADTVFLLSGGGMMHLLDAVARHPGLAYVAQHHEQASAMAADAYARRSGRIGACYATSGPGASNLLTGIIGAWQDSSPVIFVTGQSKVSQTIARSGIEGLRQFGTFEVDIVPLVRSVTKYAAVLDDPTRVRYHVARALHEAVSGRPGPVLLDVPIDVQGALIDLDEGEMYAPPPPADEELGDVAALLARLRSAERPILLAGHGVRAAGAVDAFRDVVDRLGIPVVTTQLAMDLLPYAHPLFVGHPGVKGDRAGNIAVMQADVLLTLGSSLHVLTTGYEIEAFAPDAYKIQVDLDPAVLARQEVPLQQQIRASVPAFLSAIGRDLAERPGPGVATQAWVTRTARWKRDLAVIDEPHVRQPGRVQYYDFVHVLSCTVDDDITLVTDAGSAFYVIGQAFRARGDHRVIVSGSLGAMGFALPAATGARKATDAGRVVCVTGDGSLQTNVHELAVLAQNNLDVKVFVMNNGGYASIRATQRNYFAGHEAGVDQDTGVGLPDLQSLAGAYGLPHVLLDPDDDLATQIAAVLASSGPIVCEVPTSQDDIIPTVASSKLPDGRMQSRPLDDMSPFMSKQQRADLLAE